MFIGDTEWSQMDISWVFGMNLYFEVSKTFRRMKNIDF